MSKSFSSFTIFCYFSHHDFSEILHFFCLDSRSKSVKAKDGKTEEMEPKNINVIYKRVHYAVIPSYDSLYPRGYFCSWVGVGQV